MYYTAGVQWLPWIHRKTLFLTFSCSYHHYHYRSFCFWTFGMPWCSVLQSSCSMSTKVLWFWSNMFDTRRPTKCNMWISVTHIPQKNSQEVYMHGDWIEIWNVFVEGRKMENPIKHPQSKDKKQQQTQWPMHDSGFSIGTLAILVSGEHSH